jgi:hypothetical protein
MLLRSETPLVEQERAEQAPSTLLDSARQSGMLDRIFNQMPQTFRAIPPEMVAADFPSSADPMGALSTPGSTFANVNRPRSPFMDNMGLGQIGPYGMGMGGFGGYGGGFGGYPMPQMGGGFGGYGGYGMPPQMMGGFGGYGMPPQMMGGYGGGFGGYPMPMMGGFGGGFGGGYGMPPQMMGGFGGYGGGYGMPPPPPPPQMMGGFGGYGGGYGMPQPPSRNPYASMRSGFNQFQSFGKPQGSPMQSQNMPNVAMSMDRPQAYGASDETIRSFEMSSRSGGGGGGGLF